MRKFNKNVVKKIAAGALSTAMLMGALTGCGVSTSSDEDSADAADTQVAETTSTDNSESDAELSSEVNETNQVAASADGRTEVEFWYAGGKTAVGIVEEIVEDFNNSQDEYFVTTVTQGDYDETYQKLQAGIAGNVAPDVAFLEVEPAKSLADKDLLTDLSTYIDADDSFERDDYLDVYFNQGVDGDKVFAFPAYGSTQVLYYNREVFEKAGVNAEDIKTWKQLGEISQQIKDDGIATYGWEPMWGEDNLIDMAFSNGAQILSDDGKTVTINSEEWVEVWESIRTWIHDDETMAVHSGGQGWEYWYDTMDDAVDGTAGGYIGSSGDQADLDFTVVGAMEQPAWDDDSTSYPSARAKQLVGVAQSSEEEKQGAYEFMKFFTNPENQAKWSLGTGYVSVRKSTTETEEFKAYSDEHPEILVPLTQSEHASIRPVDPTGGEIYDALKIAADKVELEGVSAQEALDEAQETAQAALDKVNAE
ncbi:multiple sugar transport system substrate-binding protein [Lachnospiraceae bacterium NE2001]|nr:multiple sugar transport system substrate-binding protein [Lachnospiraceae bacterium NE2001]